MSEILKKLGQNAINKSFVKTLIPKFKYLKAENVEEMSDLEMAEYLAERMVELNLRKEREEVPQENSSSTKELQNKSKQTKITAFTSRKT